MNSALVDYRGHFESHARGILTALRQDGQNVVCLSHSSVENQLVEDLKVFGFFNTRANSVYSSDELCWWIDDYLYQSKSFEDDLNRLNGLSSDDIIIYDCARPAQITGFANWLVKKFNPELSPTIIVILGWPTGTIVKNRDNLGNPVEWEIIDPSSILYRSSVNQINNEYRSRFIFVTPSSSAAAAYSALMKVGVDIMPNPQFYFKKQRSRVGTKLPTIGFIGEQRENKGYRLVPEIINNLFELGCNSKIIVQNSWGFMDDVNKSLLEMSNNNDLLTVVLKSYERNQWDSLLDSLDIIVLPYDVMTYSTSSSGIGAEAIANAIPQIVPENTGLSDMLDLFGEPGSKFKGTTAENVTDAIVRTLNDYDSIAAKAFLASLDWTSRNNPVELGKFFLSFRSNI